ncbi:MAG TPA: glycyl-radical enzyme activating protein [Anaerohalosphaeraceae bacterium]|nr:glycyl-radical enzyme activating protein [Anaerohalosphaeraceae bacterium]
MANTTGIIFDIKRYSINDGPGIRTTIFFKGCPLHCLWCHNPEGISFKAQLMHRPSRCIQCGRCVLVCPHKALEIQDKKVIISWEKCTGCGRCVTECPSGAMELVGKSVTADEVMKEIIKDIVFFDQSDGGVTFCGGEPLAQPKFLFELLSRCRAMDIHTTVDTSCYAPRAVLEQIMDKTSLFLCDIKHPDSAKHKEFTGVENAIILDNIRFLAEKRKPVIVRIPVIPGFNDHPETINTIGKLVADMKNIHQIDLLPYNTGGQSKSQRMGKQYQMPGIQEPSGLNIKELADILITMGYKVHAGGL